MLGSSTVDFEDVSNKIVSLVEVQRLNDSDIIAQPSEKPARSPCISDRTLLDSSPVELTTVAAAGETLN